jgi:uncharacterized protein YrrD
MQFKEGTTVVTADGQEVGDLDRIVLNPSTEKVTHLVVRKGLLLPEDKLVPLDLVDAITEDQIALKETVAALSDLTDFEETYYLSYPEEGAKRPVPADYARPVYWYPPPGTPWWGFPASPYIGFTDTPPVTEVEQNIPEGTVALQEGADVISADGKHVGDVEQIFTETETNRATHFLISQGLLLKEKKLVPTAWIDTIGERAVSLVVKSDFLDNLPEYEG